MSAFLLALVWFALLLLLAAEFGAVAGPGWSGAPPFIGLAMAGLVAVCFMRIRQGPQLVRIFAAAGVFWLLVLLGLGGLDVFTRRDMFVDQQVSKVQGKNRPE